ncbi:IDEAL domain-containing protein [Paenibacillus mendelii]|uniref:IDEAL domain-containing protein n=1 Tax=Paenibacillus mendelii TaxID=206163 RepID=A0ABV6JJE0_9BACL|nr:IDEAL domain-containing protein [Paenibacillus mendelii]MCQ6558961.1 IDEAL domain-containing protein [Paenibacillus mendelii]
MKFEISEWVQGKTSDGQLIHGFIESIESLQRIVKVHVVQSDYEDAIGTLIAVREERLKKLPELAMEDAPSIENLIDLALSTKDEAWFMELTEKRRGIQPRASKAKDSSPIYTAYTNRLGLSGTRE